MKFGFPIIPRDIVQQDGFLVTIKVDTSLRFQFSIMCHLQFTIVCHNHCRLRRSVVAVQ